jgi:hypothetical protein
MIGTWDIESEKNVCLNCYLLQLTQLNFISLGSFVCIRFINNRLHFISSRSGILKRGEVIIDKITSRGSSEILYTRFSFVFTEKNSRMRRQLSIHYFSENHHCILALKTSISSRKFIFQRLKYYRTISLIYSCCAYFYGFFYSFYIQIKIVLSHWIRTSSTVTNSNNICR